MLRLTTDDITTTWQGPEEEYNTQSVDELFIAFKGLLVGQSYSLVSLMNVVKDWIADNPELEKEADRIRGLLN